MSAGTWRLGRPLTAERALVLGLLALAAGCTRERLLTQQDCDRVQTAVGQAWRSDSRAAVQAAERRELREVVLDESAHIEAAWAEQCAARLGQPIDARELGCLEKAESIDEVRGCAEQRSP